MCAYGCPPNPFTPTVRRQSALMQLENALRMFCIACLALLFVLIVSLPLSLSPSLCLSCLLYLSVCWCVCLCVCLFAVTNRVCCRRAAHAFCARFLSPASGNWRAESSYLCMCVCVSDTDTQHIHACVCVCELALHCKSHCTHCWAATPVAALSGSLTPLPQLTSTPTSLLAQG